MRIVCPECHAAYKVGPLIKNAILVCHRCETEFDTFGNKITAHNETAQIFKHQENTAPTFGLHDLIQSGMKTRQAYIWLWMILILLIIAAVGLNIRWQHWQFNGFVRAYQVEVSNQTEVLDRDWKVPPETVHSQWLTRDDQSLVLIIEGQVESLVAAELPAPEVKVTFVTQTGKDISFTQAITEPAELKILQSAPFVSPPLDKTPVSALGTRGFLLLIEDAPRSTQHILLHALAVQKKGANKL